MHNREFKLHRSKQYLGLTGFILLLSAAILLSLSISWWLKVSLLLLLCLYGRYITRYPALCALRYNRNKQWIMKTAESTCEAVLSGDSTVTQWVTVLRFHLNGSRLSRTCIIFRDSLPAGDYRRLMVILGTL